MELCVVGGSAKGHRSLRAGRQGGAMGQRLASRQRGLWTLGVLARPAASGGTPRLRRCGHGHIRARFCSVGVESLIENEAAG
jgi:hypothetical protein